MSEKFMIFHKINGDGNETHYVGIEISVAGHSLKCPLSEGCTDYWALAERITSLQQELEELKEKVQSAVSLAEEGITLDFPLGTPAEDIWKKLSEIEDEENFVAAFNSLSEEQRMDVAEHVLTHCNIFSGKAAVFSSRYNSEAGLLE